MPAPGSTGYDWQNLLLGGQGANPADYYTPYQDRGQIQGYVQQGMGNINGTGPQLDPNQQATFKAHLRALENEPLVFE